MIIYPRSLVGVSKASVTLASDVPVAITQDFSMVVVQSM